MANITEKTENGELVTNRDQLVVMDNRVDVGSYPQHLSLHRTYGSRIRRYIHIGERKL